MPRWGLARRDLARWSPSSSSSSSDDDDAPEPYKLEEAGYLGAGLAAALRRPPDYPAAARELALLLDRRLFEARLTKQVQALVVADAELAIECADG